MPLETASVPDDQDPFGPQEPGRRLAAGCISVPFGLLAIWMYYIVHRFLVGHSWLDWIVYLLLHEFIMAVAAFAAVCLLVAIYDPKWIHVLFNKILDHLFKTLCLVLVLFGVPFLIFLVVMILNDWLRMFDMGFL